MRELRTSDENAKEWEREFLLSLLSRTYIKLQTTLDSHFARHSMTAQEAAVLVQCAGVKEISPGRLALSLGRDKGIATRWVQRLEARGFVTRKVDWRDRRFFVLKATSRGRRMVPALKLIFEKIRRLLFARISVEDVQRTGSVLRIMLENAGELSSQAKGRQRRNCSHSAKTVEIIKTSTPGQSSEPSE